MEEGCSSVPLAETLSLRPLEELGPLEAPGSEGEGVERSAWLLGHVACG